jgi:sulfotransferase
MALETAMSRRNEIAVFIDDLQRRTVLKGLFSNYYKDIHTEKVVFDTNRAWCTKLPALGQLFPVARVICCVRNIGWIMDSVERLVRRNAFELSGMFGFEPGGTVYTRLNRIAASDGLVGYALDALREAFFREDANRLILVEYQALTRAPADTLRLLYKMLGEPHFDHDFDNVEYQADDFDLALRARSAYGSPQSGMDRTPDHPPAGAFWSILWRHVLAHIRCDSSQFARHSVRFLICLPGTVRLTAPARHDLRKRQPIGRC